MTAQPNDESEPEQWPTTTSGRRARLETIRWTTDTLVLGGLALLAVLAVFWWLGGVRGAVTWVFVAAAWLLLPPIIPVAIGQFALLVVLPTDATLMTILPAEVAVLTPLLADVLGGHDTTAVDTVLFVAAVGLGGALILISTEVAGVLAAGVVLLLVAGIASYLLHRSLLLTLGHLDETD